MKKVLILVFPGLFFLSELNAQVVSRFTWDGPGATPLRADIGPNGISVNSSTVVTVIGSTSGVSNGALNAGSVAHRDINLTLPNSSIFNIASIDVQVDFRREETGASFYTRGSSFDFGLNGSQLFITFSVENGSGGTIIINSGPIYAIPDDHIFHNYRFLYDDATGRGYVWVDGVTRYTYNGTPGRALVWSNVSPVIGGLMDGTARNLGVLDNFELRLFSPAVLPFGFLNFSTLKKADHVLFNWSVVNESNLSHFIIERSVDGINFDPIKHINAKPVSGLTGIYEFADFESKDLSELPLKLSFRIRSVDQDGNFSWSVVRVVSLESKFNRVTAFPNPVTDHINLRVQTTEAGLNSWKIFTPDGRQLFTGSKFLEKGMSTIRIDLPGSNYGTNGLILVLESGKANQKTVLRIIKRAS